MAYYLFTTFYIAVSVVTSNQLTITATAYSINVSWSSSPPYPSKYQLSCVCSLLCEEAPVSNIVHNPTPQATSAIVTGLLPGSNCHVKLAEYGQDFSKDEMTDVASGEAKTSYIGTQI